MIGGEAGGLEVGRGLLEADEGRGRLEVVWFGEEGQVECGGFGPESISRCALEALRLELE